MAPSTALTSWESAFLDQGDRFTLPSDMAEDCASQYDDLERRDSTLDDLRIDNLSFDSISAPTLGIDLLSESGAVYSTDGLASLSDISQLPLYTHIDPAELSSIEIPKSLTALATEMRDAQNTKTPLEKLSPPLFTPVQHDKSTISDNILPLTSNKHHSMKRRDDDTSIMKDDDDMAEIARLERNKRRRKSSSSVKKTANAPMKPPRKGSLANFENLDELGGGMKREKFLERNRVAASKCRQKKKEWTAQLEGKLQELTAERNQLTACKDMLRYDLIELKNLLLQHVDCECVGIRQYLTHTIAQRFPTTAIYELVGNKNSDQVGTNSNQVSSPTLSKTSASDSTFTPPQPESGFTVATSNTTSSISPPLMSLNESSQPGSSIPASISD